MDRHSKEFRALQAEWDQKLKESGFVDCEQRDEHLKVWSMRVALHHSDSQREAKEEYYRAAGHFLYDYPFSDPAERRIWELHCEGVSKLKTLAIMKSEGLWFKKKRPQGWPVKPCATTIQTTLERLRDIMIKKIENERLQNS